jgi:hypothetical protein
MCVWAYSATYHVAEFNIGLSIVHVACGVFTETQSAIAQHVGILP